MPHLHPLDLIVVLAYLAGVLGIGFFFVRRNSSADAFMAADRSLPGWAVGLSIFGSYISSISFLANPGKSYAGNWNAFVFNLTTPVAALIAVRYFVPFYRRLGAVSAYDHLEHRFGPWARTYAVACFLLTQIGRMGTILFLLAIAVEPLTGLRVPTVIVGIGVLMIAVAITGGIKAVVWTGVAQSIVLVAGLLVCIFTLLFGAFTPAATMDTHTLAEMEGKFSLGSMALDLGVSSFWVVLFYGLTTNLQNFGIDQSYVQRYITARSDGDAKRSVTLGAWLYVPTGAGFFFIGTLLFLFYSSRPGLLPDGIAPDKVFPHYIATQLPAGLRGLVIAALLAAAMDSNLNNMATLTLCDLYKRYFRKGVGQRESMWVLRLSTVAWGVLGTGIGLAMIGVKSVLDAWWKWAGIFSGGMLGLFLLGLLIRKAGNAAAAMGVVAGFLVIVWMTISPTDSWPASWSAFRSPFHDNLNIVLGTLAVFLVGWLSSFALPHPPASAREKSRNTTS